MNQRFGRWVAAVLGLALAAALASTFITHLAGVVVLGAGVALLPVLVGKSGDDPS